MLLVSSRPRALTIELVFPTANYTGFASGYVFRSKRDLTDISKTLPQGMIICSPTLVAGTKHVESVLRQTAEYWSRGLYIARNRSIDLLMRISCQRQISKAVELSQIGSISQVVLCGITEKRQLIKRTESKLLGLGAKPHDKILDLNLERANILKAIHSLPDRVSMEEIALLIQEKSLALAFPK